MTNQCISCRVGDKPWMPVSHHFPEYPVHSCWSPIMLASCPFFYCWWLTWDPSTFQEWDLILCLPLPRSLHGRFGPDLGPAGNGWASESLRHYYCWDSTLWSQLPCSSSLIRFLILWILKDLKKNFGDLNISLFYSVRHNLF